MSKGILYVETRPGSPEKEAEFNAWYDGVHIPEVVALNGFVSARRFVSPDGASVAIYEIEADDVDAAVQGLFEAAGSGKLQMSDSLQTDPPPTMKTLKLVTEHQPDAVS